MIEYKRELYQDVVEELKPLFYANWDELEEFKDSAPLNPDYTRYELSEKTGVLRIFTARENGKIIGYAIYFVNTPLRFKSCKWAWCDFLYISPEFRKGRIGINLIKFVEKYLKSEGVERMQTMMRLRHPALGKVLEYLGHAAIEVTYAKVLKE